MSATFIGREKELAGVLAVVDAAAQGRGGLAVLVGEPGIGKSRLADVAAAAAAARGFRVGWGRVWEGGAPAYYPWVRALEAIGAPAPDVSAVTALDGDAARFQLFRNVLEGLEKTSAHAPILLVLDDLHAADLASLRMLEFVARELRGTHVAVLATRRDLDPAITPEAETTLARIGREGRVFILGRLERADIERLVRAEGPDLPPELAASICDAARGNPLFVGEMVRLLVADPDRARVSEIPLPYTVRDIVRRRLARLDATALPLLETAAVFGGEVQLSTLAVAVGQPAAEVAASIAKAERAGLMMPRGRHHVVFAHGLMRDAIYGDLSVARRAALHALAADVLEQLDRGAAVEVAHHALEAGAGTGLVERVSRAAEALSGAFSDEDAAALLARGVAALDAAGDARGAAELRVTWGRTLIRAGDLTNGRAACARAAAWARAGEDASLLARAALAHASGDSQGQTDAATHALLEEALARLGGGPEDLRVRVQARWASSMQPAPDPQAAAKVALGAVRVARALADDGTLLDVLHNAGGAFGEAVFVSELVDLYREAVRLGERVGDRAKLLRARVRLVFALLETGDVAGADAQIDMFEVDARSTGQPRHLWPAPLLRSMRATQEGRFADADSLAEEARDLAGQARDPLARYCLLMHRFARLRAQACGPELIALEPEILAVVGRWNDAAAYSDFMIALVRAAAADVDVARRHLLRVPRQSTPCRIRASVAALASIVVRVGERDRAADLYERLLPEAGRWHVLMFGGFSAEATYARLLGGLAALLGRDAEADAHYAQALARAEEAAALPEQARVLAAHARALAGRQSAQDRARAPAMFTRARALAERLALADVLAATHEVWGEVWGEAGGEAGTEPVVPAVEHGPDRSRTGGMAESRLTLVPEGETWVIQVGGESVRLKDSRGVRYVARLVAEPGREIHALDLAGAGGETDSGDAGEALDPAAVAAYRRRLAELDEEAREADGWHDGARASRVRSEIEFLSAEVARAVGLGGRNRRVGSAAERARVAVTRRIREVVRRVGEQSPDLGRQLEATLKTGTYCSYRPI
jgi:tetratricopeptide (TPR) repeat protein